MAAMDDRNTLGRARVSFADERDIDEFVTMLGRFERGEVGPDEWRAFRLVRGTYGQRQAEDAQMLRVKIPQGEIDVAEHGPHGAPVLVFVHGALVDGRLWKDVVPLLSRTYRCIVPDWPMGSHRASRRC